MGGAKNLEAMRMYRRLRHIGWSRVGAYSNVVNYFRTLDEGF